MCVTSLPALAWAIFVTQHNPRDLVPILQKRKQGKEMLNRCPTIAELVSEEGFQSDIKFLTPAATNLAPANSV